MRLRAPVLFDPIRLRNRLQGPVWAQVQTVDRCNAACRMCLYSSLNRRGPAHFMDEGLYARILDGFRRSGTLKLLELMLQNEPLMDGQLARRIRLAREALGPGVQIGTVTNGSPLTEKRAQELLEAGLDMLEVSIDAASRQTYELIHRGLDFDRVIRNTESVLRRAGRTTVRVRFLKLRQNEAEQEEFVRYWRSRGVPVLVYSLVNRAGRLDEFERLKRPRDKLLIKGLKSLAGRLYPRCIKLFTTINVLWDGRVILCSNDWTSRVVVGDLSQQSLPEVWNGERMNYYRHLLWAHRYAQSPPCSDCSVVRFR